MDPALPVGVDKSVREDIRIERHDDRIEAFFDSIGVKLTHCEEDADQPFLRINEVARTVGA